MARKPTGPMRPGGKPRPSGGALKGTRTTRNKAGDELTTDAQGNKLTYKVASSGAIWDYRAGKYVHSPKPKLGTPRKRTPGAPRKRG